VMQDIGRGKEMIKNVQLEKCHCRFCVLNKHKNCCYHCKFSGKTLNQVNNEIK
jgi:hypothetical protein